MPEEKLDPVRLVDLGRVLKPHGLKGELCIELYADSPFIFDGLTRLYLQLPGKKPRPCVLHEWRPHQERALILVDKCQGRDQAEAWRGAEVLVRERDLPARDEGEIASEDLLGLSVERVGGEMVGVLEDIRVLAGQEIWFIRDDADNEILIPAVEEIVLEIDLARERIVIDPPEGLIELYQQS